MAEPDEPEAAPSPAMASEVELSSSSESPSTFSFPSTAVYSSEDETHNDDLQFPLPAFVLAAKLNAQQGVEDDFTFPGEKSSRSASKVQVSGNDDARASISSRETDSAASSGYFSVKDGMFNVDRETTEIAPAQQDSVPQQGSDQAETETDRDADSQVDSSRVSDVDTGGSTVGSTRDGNSSSLNPVDVEAHCDVLDLVRRGVQNWRTLARMSGWLVCRGHCCHDQKPGSGTDNRKDSQDTNSSASGSAAACCSRKSTSRSSSPMKAAPPASPVVATETNRKQGQGAGSSSACCHMKSSTPRSCKVGASSANEISVRVPPGMIGLAWLNSEPLLLASKSYSFPSASFSLQELAVESSRVVNHGKLHRVVVPEGKLGVAWVDGHAKVIEPGVHVWNCSTFAYTPDDDRDATEKEIALGPYRVVTVKEDEVGVKYCNRKPQLLYAGRHLIDISKVEVFAGFESLRIRRTTASDLVACTRDEIMGEAQVSVRWQIAPQDIAMARAASVADIEAAVVTKLRRSFAIVFWCLRTEDIIGMLPLWKEDSIMVTGPMQAFSVEISRRCLEAVGDLFEEGWKVTFWGMWFESLKLRKYTRARPPSKAQPPLGQPETKAATPRKKKVQIFVTEEE